MNSTFVVPSQLLEHLARITLSSIVVFLSLCSLAVEPECVVCISTSALARATGLSRRTIFAAVAHLETLGLIRRSTERSGGANRFEIIAVTSATPLSAPALPATLDLVPSAAGSGVVTEDDLQSGDQKVSHSGAETAAQGYESNVSSENASEIETLDDVVARVYRAEVRAADLRRFVACDEETFRRCLDRLSSRGIVTEGTPLRDFVNALLAERRAL
jgi:DNA-binding transcriptional MocR family regulator